MRKWRPTPLIRASLLLHLLALIAVFTAPTEWRWALGGVLANHSYTHSVLSQVTSEVLDTEIVNTNALLKQISGADPVLFRPPYGARNETVLAGLKQRNMKSIMWNIDSKDWADPVPSSIANRVMEEVEREGRGIILLHDIHERTIDALEIILEGLQKQGYRFAAWDGKDFVAPLESTATKAVGHAGALYRESWAVIVGIDDYEKWPKLRYAVVRTAALRSTTRLGTEGTSIMPMKSDSAFM